jgi:RAD54-like protein 2
MKEEQKLKRLKRDNEQMQQQNLDSSSSSEEEDDDSHDEEEDGEDDEREEAEIPANSGEGEAENGNSLGSSMAPSPSTTTGAPAASNNGGKRSKKKRRNHRRNIKDVLTEKELEETTRKAQAEEQERLRRLQEQRKQRLQEAYLAQIQDRTLRNLQQEQQKYQRHFQEMQRQRNGGGCVMVRTSVVYFYFVVLKILTQIYCSEDAYIISFNMTSSYPQQYQGPTFGSVQDAGVAPPVVSISSSSDNDAAGPANGSATANGIKEDSDDVKILSDEEVAALNGDVDDDDDGEDDPNNFGSYVDDRLNVPDESGRVLVNPDHPDADEPDVFLAPQLARAIKPHQIGGVRFLYENIIESHSQYERSSGFGCILAHAMGLGKTLQVVSFVDVFLRHTSGRHVLCVVPINTIQNWISEFDYWLPSDPSASPLAENGLVRPRNFSIHLLNDALKNLEMRAKVILQWQDEGGVLLMGYELYRQLANKKPRKPRKKKGSAATIDGPECVDVEEEDRTKTLLDRERKF